ncbi:glycosyl transferase group 1 [Leptolyngbya sp. Heron Island J]|uniref:glycosyltransferase family 4 protein n=1 Tax=Leptolyngbya sp. Heron Island J TaxID=1385935 RepID=UPI0003B93EB5|nr:glycosyltransferase family 4 protein [Leptolyngbya sp. Heron Island J]ESA38759.1 glycosyl transferase group 1 [Leptolyngbya sp. Heron Island J]
MKRIALLFENYGPYHMARLAALEKLYSGTDFEVIPMEIGRFQKKYAWEVGTEEIPQNLVSVIEDDSIEESSFLKVISKLFSKLNDINPDTIAIAGYAELPMLASLLWATLFRKHTILMSASKADDSKRIFITELIKKAILRLFRTALVGGQPQKRYLLALGKSAESIFTGYNVVGNDNFHPKVLSKFSSPIEQPFFLTINRFIAKKNLHTLIDAYAKYRQICRHCPYELVLSGDGELYHALEKQVESLNLKSVVHFTGFLQQKELLPYLAHASCFIHASAQEQWGLVVNEAMAAGLPVIVSNRCGCFEDLVIEGVNGFGFDPNSQDQLTDIMLKVSSSDVDLDEMGEAALSHIQQFSPARFAQGFNEALEYMNI